MSNQKSNKWMPIVFTISAVLLIILVAVFAVNGKENHAIALEEQVHTAQSDIQVQEKRRVDLVYNLADCVKQYDKYEAETLKAVVDGRGGNGGNVENITTYINAAAEAYPELKSNDNYKELMNELATTENLIAEFRSNYNKEVKEYNRYVRKFPNKQFLSLLGYEVLDLKYLDYNAPSDAPQNLFGE